MDLTAEQWYDAADIETKRRKENPPEFRCEPDESCGQADSLADLRPFMGDPKPAKRLLRKDQPKPGDWRDRVLERDQGCCVHGNPAACEPPFQAHHVVLAQTLRREAPDLLWDDRAGMGVCSKAHRQHHAGTRPIELDEIPEPVYRFLLDQGFVSHLYRHYLKDSLEGTG